VAHIYHDTDRLLLNANNHVDGPTPGVNAHPLTTERDFITEFRQPWALQHRAFSGNTETLFHHIQATADTNSVPTHENDEEMISTLQHLHMSDLLQHDDDAIDPNGPNDIDVSRIVPNGTANNDYTIRGHPAFQRQIRPLIHEYDDICSYNVKGKAMYVPPMTFTVATNDWKAPVNRLPSRLISVEKHAALNQMIDDLQDLKVMQPSRSSLVRHREFNSG